MRALNSPAVVVTLNGATDAIVSVGGIAEDTIRNIENVTGGSAADILTGDGLANVLAGGSGSDNLMGGGGDDILIGGAGSNKIDGGIGVNTAAYSGLQSNYQITLTGGVVHVVGLGASDTLTNIQLLSFSDGAGGTEVIAVKEPGTPDLEAGSDSGTSSADNTTKVTMPIFTGMAEAGATVTLYDGATIIGTSNANKLGSWSIKTHELTEGKHTIRAKVTDTAGNSTLFSKGLSMTIDTTTPGPPGTPDLAAASDTGMSTSDNITRISTLVLTGKAEAGAAITLYDGATIFGTGSANALGDWSIKATTLAQGTHTIRARATDRAGNVGGLSAGLRLIIDTTAPAPPGTPDLLASSDSGTSTVDNITHATGPSFAGKAEVGSTVTLYAGSTAVGTAKTDSLGAWIIKASTLANGTHTFCARTTDAAGNPSALSTGLSLIIDTVAPPMPTAPDLVPGSDTGTSTTDDNTKDTTPTFVGKTEARATVTLFDGTTAIGTTKADGLGAWSVTASTLTSGAHSVRVKVADAAGNASIVSPPVSITIDTTVSPSVPDMASASDYGSSNTDNVTKATAPTFTGKTEAGATIKLFDGAMQVGSAKANSTGAWSIKSSVLTEGVHALTTQVTDVAGNTSAASTALSVTIDTKAPTPPTIPDLRSTTDSGASNSDNITNVTTPTFVGTAEANATVTLYEGAKALGSAKASAGGSWSIKSSALIDGKHVINARSTDLAGNVSTFSSGLAVTIDTTVPITAPQVTSVTTKSVSGVAEASSLVTMFDNGVAIPGTITTNATGAWTKAIALPPGTHTITGQSADRAGNVRAIVPPGYAVVGTAGDDILTAPLGPRLMAGGAGNDTYHVDDSADVITEGSTEGAGDIVLASVGYTLGAASRIEFLSADAGAGGLALTGNGFANTITGGDGNDVIAGTGGADPLLGGGGADVFAMLALRDSTAGAAGRDTIGDLSEIEGDLIGLSGIDANTAVGGDQAFTFIGAAAFSGVGQVRAEVVGGNTIVSGNVNAVLGADFAITLTGSHALTGANFIL